MSRPACRIPTLLVLALLPTLPWAVSWAEEPNPKNSELDFARDILPIFSDHCYQCHGPDAGAAREGDLRVDEREDLIRSRGDYAIVVPGDSEASELVTRILSNDPSDQMPPPELDRALSEEQKQLLSRWIDEGAPWGKHWAFEVPRRPEVPNSQSDASRSHPIDALIAAQHTENNVTPTRRASKATLVRRLCLDLTGLPPTSDQIQEFIHAKDPPELEQLVDQLLASEAFGERMAWDWLEAARYADSNGYQGDRERTMWPWRDWVVRAFNENLPFDEFTRWQLAGDLLADPTDENVLATGFCRNHMINGEGGRIAEENRVDYVMDMTETMGTVWLGLTLNCCRCHDHKFDPLRQEEYFQLTAFFNQTPVTGQGGDPQTAPTLAYPSSSQRERQAELAEQLSNLRTKLRTTSDQLIERHQATWESEQAQAGDTSGSWLPLAPISAEADHQNLEIADGKILATGENPTNDHYRLQYKVSASMEARAIVLHAIKHPDMTEGGLARSNSGNFVLTEIRISVEDQPLEIQSATASFEQGGLKITNAFDESPATGWAVYDGQPVDRDHWAKFVIAPTKFAEGQLLHIELDFDSPHAQHNLGHFAFYIASDSSDEFNLSNQEFQRALRVNEAQRSQAQKQLLRQRFLEDQPAVKELEKKIAQVQKQQKDLAGRVPKVMVMRDRKVRRPTFILERGLYNQPQGEVSAATPLSLHPFVRLSQQADADESQEPNRLDLAHWILDPQNPLTARVIVNCYWQMLFGVGLVKTTEDFGVQSEYPIHKELLDWLAVEFIESGWDVKHLLKLIVTSEAYQRSSDAPAELWERDPENRLLARGPRFRMPSWMLRDQALALSGLLVRKVGGPPVKPYQPAGLWSEATFGKKSYTIGEGDELYRRSLYTFWRRILGPTMFFDAGKRQVCEVKPTRTNTPMHALTTLNDITFVEASRALAGQVLERERSLDESLQWLARRVLCRGLSPQELDIWNRSLTRAREFYEAESDQTAELLSIGELPVDESLDTTELAAWTNVCLNMLNLDEVLTKE